MLAKRRQWKESKGQNQDRTEDWEKILKQQRVVLREFKNFQKLKMTF